MQRIYKKGIGVVATGLFLTLATGCKKLVEPDASNEKIGVEAVYSNDKTAASVLTRLFANMQVMSEGSNGFAYYLALSADELKLGATVGTSTQQVHFNTMRNDPTQWWYEAYKHIYTTNDAIEMLSKTPGTTERVRNLLIGEARFARAFNYFYLINTYGDVPFVLTTDYRQNLGLGRTSTTEIYKQIISDLKDAKQLLSADYLLANMTPSTAAERVRPTKAAASALLARVYLYTGDYVNAEKEATLVIENPLYTLPELSTVFLRTSKEAIWQVPCMTPGMNVQDGGFYILRKSTPTAESPYLVSNALLNAFETGDLRITKWIGDSSGNKFINKYKFFTSDVNKPVVEALMMLRVGEQYLIRAEARIRETRIADGVSDLNKIRQRSRGTNPGDLPDLPTNLTQEDAVKAVEHERQVELFTEWGHRWYDLKRTNRLDAVMSVATPLKSNNTAQWEPFRKLWMVPAAEISGSPGMVGQQNPGWPQ